LIQLATIKGTPKRYLMDCLMAHKKESLLEIAQNQMVAVKKSHTKKVIATQVAKHILYQFDEGDSFLEEDEKNGLLTRLKVGQLEKSPLQEAIQLKLASKGYTFDFVENQHIQTIVPVEIAQKLRYLSNQLDEEIETPTALWFLKTQQAIESIYHHSSLSDLTTAWNNHALNPLTSEEVEQFFN
jgi:hypothetical protein